MTTENEQPMPFVFRNDLSASYLCPDLDCNGVVKYETTGYWQCSDCSFRSEHFDWNEINPRELIL